MSSVTPPPLRLGSARCRRLLLLCCLVPVALAAQKPGASSIARENNRFIEEPLPPGDVPGLDEAARAVGDGQLIWDPRAGYRLTDDADTTGISNEAVQQALTRLTEGRRARERGSNWEALRKLKPVYDRFEDTLFAPEAMYQAGLAYRARRQFDDAFELFSRLLERYPGYTGFNRVVSAQYETATLISEGRRPRYWGVIPGFRTYEEAMKYYNEVVDNAPYSEYAPLALMQLANLAQRRGKEAEAIDALDRLINNYPDSFLAPDAYLQLADAYANLVKGPWYDQGATREAVSYYEDFLILFPDNPAAAQAEAGLQEMQNTLSGSKYLLGDFYWRYRNNPRAALVYYNETITVDPDSQYAERARAGIERIRAGTPPPRTPVDFLFGRYDNPEPVDLTTLPGEDGFVDEEDQIGVPPMQPPVDTSPLAEGARPSPDETGEADDEFDSESVPVRREQETRDMRGNPARR